MVTALLAGTFADVAKADAKLLAASGVSVRVSGKSTLRLELHFSEQ